VASVLGADYARLGEELVDLAQAGVDLVQWDVMDGRFVPVVSFGADVIAACRKDVDLPFEAHLMVWEPERHLEEFVEAGCMRVIVHAEATTHLHRTLAAIRAMGVESGVALSPATPLAAVRHVLDQADLLLVMTVNPGFGGQPYLHSMEAKIAEARAHIDDQGLPVQLEVDGGITAATIAGARRAGAELFISGSWLLSHPKGKVAAVSELRQAAGLA
jgi:ribulose-phosphate 3-epimerase